MTNNTHHSGGVSSSCAAVSSTAVCRLVRATTADVDTSLVADQLRRDRPDVHDGVGRIPDEHVHHGPGERVPVDGVDVVVVIKRRVA